MNLPWTGPRCPRRPIERYLEFEIGEVSRKRRAWLARHAGACAECGAIREDVRAIARTASGMATMAPSRETLVGVMDLVRATPRPTLGHLALRHAVRASRLVAAVTLTTIAGMACVCLCANWARPRMVRRPDLRLASLRSAFRYIPIPEPNAVDAYYAVARVMPGSSYFSWQAQATDQAEDAALDRAGVQQLAVLREAFAANGRARRPLDYHHRGWVLDRCVALLGAHGRVAQRRGDAEEACRSGLDILRMAQDVTRGGGFGNAWWGLGAQMVGQRLLADNIEKLDLRPATELLQRLRRLQRTRVPLAEIVIAEACTAPTPSGPSFGWPLSNWLRPDRERAIEKDRYIAAMLNSVNKPSAFRRLPAAPAGVFGWRSSRWPSEFCRHYDTNEARNRCISLALAVRRFRLERGRLPRGIREVPDEDRSSALDPVTGVYLHYRLTDAAKEGFIVYSVGPDLDDDNGRPAIENRIGDPGDIGVRPFAWPTYGDVSDQQDYRRVPYMLPPILEASWPPLPD